MATPILSMALLMLAAAQAEAQSEGSLLFVSPMGEIFRGEKASSPDAKWFAQADRNHDGKLTAEEMVADADRFFALLDTDKDGEIGPRELAHYEAMLARNVGRYHGRRKTDSDLEDSQTFLDPTEAEALLGDGAARFNYLGMPEPVIAADTNLNRGVSLDEFERAAWRRFQLLDVNSKGAIALKDLANPSRKPR